MRKNSDLIFGALVCSVASSAFAFVHNRIDNKFFKGVSIAKALEESVASLTNNQIEAALNHCVEGNLAAIKTPNPLVSGFISSHISRASYASALAIAAAAPVTEEEKYFLLAAAKITAGFLIHLCEKKLVRDKLPEKQLCNDAFLRNFSPEEQKEIGESLIPKLRKCQGYSEECKNFVVGAAITFAFVGVLSQNIVSTDSQSLTSEAETSAANFAIASAAQYDNTEYELVNSQAVGTNNPASIVHTREEGVPLEDLEAQRKTNGNSL